MSEHAIRGTWRVVHGQNLLAEFHIRRHKDLRELLDEMLTIISVKRASRPDLGPDVYLVCGTIDDDYIELVAHWVPSTPEASSKVREIRARYGYAPAAEPPADQKAADVWALLAEIDRLRAERA